ncbi:ABC transporter permease [Spelaeicoccus albus]|uniref:ABC-2 type transport system permease protein n=1 Tax=Spelaeicoccus albus TaxID=1280376 RepID=A0A7Z0CZC0_9MICO|nr:ABC transporter permease [Spelaeicoccus albus]NYI66176.1 ABC-2 type transport system permease protein [Spelaeicoccus albus]
MSNRKSRAAQEKAAKEKEAQEKEAREKAAEEEAPEAEDREGEANEAEAKEAEGDLSREEQQKLVSTRRAKKSAPLDPAALGDIEAADDDEDGEDGGDVDELPEELRDDESDELPPSGLVTDRMPPTSGGTLWLVAHREMTATLRSKAFLISTLVMVLAVLGAVIGGHLYSSKGSDMPTVAMVGVTAKQVPQAEQQLSMHIKPAKTKDAAKSMVLDGSVDAAIDSDKQTGKPIIIAKSDKPTAVSDAIDKVLSQSGSPEVKYLQPKDHSNTLINSLGIGLAGALLVIVLVLGVAIAQTVVDERRNRANEVLLSVVKAKSLMSGKVVGRGVLGLAQAVLLSAIVLLALSIIGPTSLAVSTSITLGWAMLLFAGGLALFAGLFAAAAAARTHLRRVIWLTVMVLALVLPLIAAVIYQHNDMVMKWLSYLPLSSPVVMPVRIFTGGLEWWAPLAAVGGMIVGVWIVLAVCGSIYKRATHRSLSGASR